MDRARRNKKPPGLPPGPAGPTQLLAQVVKQAQFQACTPRELAVLRASPVPCTALVVACFREDGHVLMLQSAGGGMPWDLPHGPLPAGGDPVAYGAELLSALSGVALASPLYLFGIVDWGAAARSAGWGWTACLFGEIGRRLRLPKTSWASRRAFLPVLDALARVPADPWQRLRRETLEEGVAVFESLRDFWLLQSLDAVSRSDLEDILE